MALDPGNVHLWLVQPSQLASHFNRLASYLCNDEQARAERYKLPAPRRQFIMSRGFLRQTIASYLSVDPCSLRFGIMGNEKPTLLNSDLHFNLSHTADFIAIALACDRPVGVDVEHIMDRNSLEAITRQQFHPDEHLDFQSADAAQKLAVFYRIWTCKEAYLKGLGHGLSQPLSSFAMVHDDGRYVPRPALDGKNWSVMSRIQSDCALALAAPGDWTVQDVTPTHAATSNSG